MKIFPCFRMKHGHYESISPTKPNNANAAVLKCSDCSHISASASALSIHRDFVHPLGRKVCLDCGFPANTDADLSGHRRDFHGHTLDYACDRCTFSTWTQDLLDRHGAERHKRPSKRSPMVLIRRRTDGSPYLLLRDAAARTMPNRKAAKVVLLGGNGPNRAGMNFNPMGDSQLRAISPSLGIAGADDDVMVIENDTAEKDDVTGGITETVANIEADNTTGDITETANINETVAMETDANEGDTTNETGHEEPAWQPVTNSTEMSLSCEHCSFVGESLADMEEHLRYGHLGVLEEECGREECGFRTFHGPAMEHHERTKH